jgi:carbonic anhydrase
VTAAVDSYLAPRDYASIALTHALRSLVDRIQVAVRGAATALERVAGAAVAWHPSYRDALVETAIYLNAAITAYDVRREVDRHAGDAVRVVYGVFDLVQQRVRGRPAGAASEDPGPIPILADVPSGPDDFGAISAEIAAAVAARRLQPVATEYLV